MIETKELSKVFVIKKGTDITAVEDLTLSVPEGEVFGFLGPNGAGKTTTVRMLTSLIAPTSGQAWINGLQVGVDDQEIRRSVGILTESPGLYERLSASKNLEIYANLYDVDNVARQVEKYLHMLGLWSRRDDPAGSFSKGMRQKLAIARALLHEPGCCSWMSRPAASTRKPPGWYAVSSSSCAARAERFLSVPTT